MAMLTESQLRKIIREELQQVLSENMGGNPEEDIRATFEKEKDRIQKVTNMKTIRMLVSVFFDSRLNGKYPNQRKQYVDAIENIMQIQQMPLEQRERVSSIFLSRLTSSGGFRDKVKSLLMSSSST